MFRDHFTVQVIQVHLFTFCFALRRVKRPVSVSTATTHSSHNSSLLRGGLRKCACVFCVCGPTVFNNPFIWCYSACLRNVSVQSNNLKHKVSYSIHLISRG